MKLTLQLPIPDKVLLPNARVHWVVKSKAVKAARALAKAEGARVLADAGISPPLWGKAKFKAVLFYTRGTQPDPDNFNASMKSYCDGIADARIVANDRNLWPERPEFIKVAKMPRVEITIEEER